MSDSSASFILLFLLCQLTGPATSGARKELVGALGGSVTFPVTHSANQINTVVWFFNATPLVTIQPKITEKEDNVIVTENHNKERVSFPHGNYSLKLSKLSKSDSGVYHVNIFSSLAPGRFTQEYELRVYEPLSKPKVSMGLQNKKNGTCVTNLTCSMEEGGEDVTYSWESLGQTTNESHNGPILPISWRLGEKDMTFICMAKNPISSSSSNPIFAWKLCEGAAGDLASTTTRILLPVFVLLVVLVLVPIIFIMWRRRKESIEEKKRMDTYQESFNHLPSGETSENDTISNHNTTVPEGNAVSTLYSTVQIPKKMEKTCSLPTSQDTPKSFTYENVI